MAELRRQCKACAANRSTAAFYRACLDVAIDRAERAEIEVARLSKLLRNTSGLDHIAEGKHSVKSNSRNVA